MILAISNKVQLDTPEDKDNVKPSELKSSIRSDIHTKEKPLVTRDIQLLRPHV